MIDCSLGDTLEFCAACFQILFCSLMQCRLIAVLWLNNGILISLLATEPLSVARLLNPSQYLCGTIFLTLYSMVWNWRVSSAGPMFFFVFL